MAEQRITDHRLIGSASIRFSTAAGSTDDRCWNPVAATLDGRIVTFQWDLNKLVSSSRQVL
jgi:hypothetical protein